MSQSAVQGSFFGVDELPVRAGERGAGRIASLNVSVGGVPKLPVQEARLGAMGLEGDRHRNRRLHGGAVRALCLYALEHIRALQSEGHPIAAGTTGENVTLEGIDWAVLVPGARLALGDAVVEVTEYTEPCKVIRGSFRDGDPARMDQDRHPGWSRVYARVLTEATLRADDTARVLDAPLGAA